MKEKHHASPIALLVAFLIAMLMLSNKGVAEVGKTNFSVRAILPENQVDTEISYFYVKLRPGQTQTLRVSIRNSDDEDILVGLQTNTAFSNPNGMIDYSASGEQPAEGETDLQTLVTMPESKVRVPAGGEAEAEFVLKMPNEPFDGELLGGLVFTREPEETQDRDRTPGMKIHQVFNYCIALRITQGRPIPETAPKLALTGAYFGEMVGFPTLVVTAHNPQPRILKDMRMDIHLYPEDSSHAMIAFEDLTVSMAPYSTMPYTLLLRGENAPQPGSYRAVVSLRTGEEAWDYEAMLIFGT